MQTKLTLSVDKDTIEQAKAYAKKHGVSLSKMIQEFLSKKIQADMAEEVEVPEDLKDVYGAVKVPKDFDYKKAKKEYLEKKYL